MTERRLSATLLAALVAAGCSSPERSTDNRAHYTLRRAGADTVPAVVRDDGSCRFILEAGSVTFGAGDYESVYHMRKLCPPDRDSVFDVRARGSVRFSNDTAYFATEAGTDAGSGILTGDSLVVAGRLQRLTFIRGSAARP